MLDNGFIGHFPEGAIVPLALQCRSQDLQVVEPTGIPTCKIIDPNTTVVESAELRGRVDGLTGFRMEHLELSESNKWQPGVVYTVVFSYVSGGEDRSCLSTFQVV